MERTKVTTCWECNTSTSRPIAVTLEVLTGRLETFMLCPPCYRTHYHPLIAAASRGIVPRRALPRVELDPGEVPLML
jgi:hypothetical protein